MNTQQMRSIQPVDYKFDRKVKESQYQIKKHYSMFNPTESALLNCCVHNLAKNHLLITDHAKDHIKDFTHSMAKSTLLDCNVIEFNVNMKFNLECRVLVRGNKTLPIRTENGIENGNVCMVIDIKESKLISAYINRSDDLHSTLRSDRYNKDLNIIKYAMELN